MRELIAGRITKSRKDEEGGAVGRSAAEIMCEVILEGMLGNLELYQGKYGRLSRTRSTP